MGAGPTGLRWLVDETSMGLGKMLAIGAVRRAYRAEEIEGPDRARAIAELILKYGTPAEGLGVGPAFRLRPLDD